VAAPLDLASDSVHAEAAAARVPTAAEAATLHGLSLALPGTGLHPGLPALEKADVHGLICEDAWGAIATKRGSSTFAVRVPDYSFPRWWLHNVDGAHDSYQGGPIKTLRVVR
jgi:hypothetical protein